jgi:hypothetical protein
LHKRSCVPVGLDDDAKPSKPSAGLTRAIADLLGAERTLGSVIAQCCRKGIALNDVLLAIDLTAPASPPPAVLSFRHDGAAGVVRVFGDLSGMLRTGETVEDLAEGIRCDLDFNEEHRAQMVAHPSHHASWVLLIAVRMLDGVRINWVAVPKQHQSLGVMGSRELVAYPGLLDLLEAALAFDTPAEVPFCPEQFTEFQRAMEKAIDASLIANKPVRYPPRGFAWVDDEAQVRAKLWGGGAEESGRGSAD